MLRLFAFAWLAVIIIPAGFTAAQTTEPAAQLLLPSRHLQPTSTFEVRFAAEMVPADQIGKTTESPLVFEPALEGQFVWLSTRSGSFAPASPFPLGTKVKISLRRGLKDATGKKIAAKLSENAETPPMRMKGSSALGRSESDNATATPRYLLLFNTNVDASAAAKFIWWEDFSGKRIPARVEQADETKNKEHRFYAWWSDDHSLATWSESFNAREPVEESESEGDEEAIPTLRLKLAQAPRSRVAATESSIIKFDSFQVGLPSGLS